MSETVRVRIAVAVSDEGDWCARGLSGSQDSDAVDSAFMHLSPARSHEAVHWIEADVPIPTPQTIQGEAKP